MKNDIDNKFEKGVLLFYAYRSIPDQVKNNYSSRMKFFFKPSKQLNKLNRKVQVSRYSGYQDTGWETCDVVLIGNQFHMKLQILGPKPKLRGLR